MIFCISNSKNKIFSWTVHCCDRNYSMDLAKYDRQHFAECISPMRTNKKRNKTSATITISFFLNMFLMFLFPWLSLPMFSLRKCALFFLYVFGKVGESLLCTRDAPLAFITVLIWSGTHS